MKEGGLTRFSHSFGQFFCFKNASKSNSIISNLLKEFGRGWECLYGHKSCRIPALLLTVSHPCNASHRPYPSMAVHLPFPCNAAHRVSSPPCRTPCLIPTMKHTVSHPRNTVHRPFPSFSKLPQKLLRMEAE